jgi:two-component system cell cycle sensor histidine kinase/response regulator CckA
LPREADASDRANKDESKMKGSAVAESECRTIVVVDDEAPIRELIGRMLRYQGFEVLEATSGAGAAELCASHPKPVRLVVTDLTMPGVSGNELGEQLMGTHAHMRVLYISGNAGPGSNDVDRRTSFLQKPFSYAALVAAVKELLSRDPTS